MIRRLHQRLRLVGYYSRSRHRTVWTRALDVSLIVTFFLAVPLTLVSEALWSRATTLGSVHGGLERDEDAGLIAPVADRDGDVAWSSARPFGDWMLVVESTDRGWPYPSLRQVEPPRLDLHLFDEPGGLRIAGDAPADAESRAAIEIALRTAGRHELLDRWRHGTTLEQQRSWFGTLLNAGVWWIVPFAVSAVVIRLLALGAHLVRARKSESGEDRRRRGRCPSCNYDLRGLEFHDRCPECGALQE